MSINLIAAMDLSCGIGYRNELLVKLPNDLKRFKELTTNEFVCMGRKTYESIGHPLPNRYNIVLTRDMKYNSSEGVYIYNSINDVLFEYQNYNGNENELYIIGGAEIYNQALPYAEKLFLTVIETEFPKADTFFPRFSLVDWKVIDRVDNKKDENHPYNYSFVTYSRRN